MTYNTFGCFLFDLLTLLLLVVLANQSRRLIAFLPAVILPVCLAIFQVFGLFNDSSAGFHAPSIHAATLFDLRFSAVVFASTIATYAYTTNLRRLLMRSTAADRLITKVLADSVSVCPSGLGPTIGQSLEDVASFVRADYANIMVISQDRAILSCEYEYCLPGVNGWQAELKSLDLRGMPWTAANLNENKVVYLRSMSMLPPEAKAERDLPTFRAGIKSIASLPLTFGGRVNGLLNLASFTRESPWTGETIEHLRAIANTFASSIERQRAAREVIESESKYRIAFDNAPLGMYRNTVDGRVISVNNMMATMFGASSVEEIMELQDDIATQFYANPGERADFVREVLESAGYVCREIVERRLDGTELTVRSKMRAVRDEAGRPLYTEGFIEDITETKRAFESLQRRYEFDKLITSIVAKFASCDAQDIDGSVISALEGLAGALRAEQAYVIMVSPDGVRYSATHEWTSPDVSPLAPYYQNVSMGFAPWTEQTILSDLVVNVSRLSDYPRIADRELKAAPARLGRKSFLGVPIHGRAGSIAGMIAMGTFSREVSWSDRDIAKLRIAGDAVACVLERKISEEATRRQSQYDELISKTLFRFATCRPEHIDESVELALKDICDVFNGERAFLTLFSDDLSTYTCTHEWFRDNYGPAKQNFVNVLIGTLPKMESAILADSPIILAEFDEPGIGPDTLTKFLATIKSRLIVPIHGLAGTIIGMVGLSSYSDKVAWTEKDIAQVRLLGDALANVIERKRADNALKRAAEFDELIAKLLSDFATCASRDLDVTITRAIRTFGSYVGASHAHISMLAQDRTGYTCTHEWCDDGAPSMAIEIQNLPMGSMPWFENIILGDNNVRLRNVGDLPKDVRNERSSPYLRLGYKSLLIVPIRNGEITGSIALASYETTIDWQDGDIRHLKVVGDAIASLIDRNRTEQEVRDLNSSLEQRINRRTADLEEARKKAIEIMHDVDEQRRRAEEALAQLEFTTEHLRLLSQAVDNSPAMVMITDKAYQIEYVNPKFTEVTGYAAAEVLGRDSAFLLYDSDSDGANGELSSALAAGIHWSGEIRSRRKSGELFWEFASFAPIKGADGIVRHYVAVQEDITERRALQDELRLARDAAEAANRTKSQFLANMSHEIRTPMNAILGFSQLLQNSTAFAGLQKQHLDIINRSGEHLLSLINDILEMSRIEAGRILLTRTAVDVKALITDLSIMFRMRCADKNISFTVEQMEDLPRYIDTDENKIRQILTNLLGNAVKLTDHGGVILRVRIGAAQLGHCCMIAEVEDSGPGIAENEWQKVFKPFEQTTSGMRARSGTGLGLAISQQFAQMLGGEITFTSQVDVGSVFRLIFPIEEVNNVLFDYEPSKKQVVELTSDCKIRKVLVVDDEPENRALLTTLLNDVGFETREAEEGESSLVACREWLPDVVLMDAQMPVMDGYEAIRQIRSTPMGKHTPIIGVSASAYEEDRQRMIDAGANEFLPKPLRVESLYATIAAVSGATYRYRENDPDDESAAKAPATTMELKQRLSLLPSKLAAKIRDATIDADFDRVIALVDQISDTDRTAADSLRAMAEQYEAARIISLLTPEN